MAKFTHEVVAQYQIGRYEKGQVISQHSSYELARKAAKRAGDHFTAIREVPSGFRMAKPGAAETLTRGRY
jgi:hypothetical protein